MVFFLKIKCRLRLNRNNRSKKKRRYQHTGKRNLVKKNDFLALKNVTTVLLYIWLKSNDIVFGQKWGDDGDDWGYICTVGGGGGHGLGDWHGVGRGVRGRGGGRRRRGWTEKKKWMKKEEVGKR